VTILILLSNIENCARYHRSKEKQYTYAICKNILEGLVLRKHVATKNHVSRHYQVTLGFHLAKVSLSEEEKSHDSTLKLFSSVQK
jgi:hypothetical protein